MAGSLLKRSVVSLAAAAMLWSAIGTPIASHVLPQQFGTTAYALPMDSGGAYEEPPPPPGNPNEVEGCGFCIGSPDIKAP